MESDTPERRRAPRIPFHGPVLIVLEYHQVLTYAGDISTTGISIRVPLHIEATKHVGVEFVIPDQGSVELQGVLVHQASGEGDTRAGIEFIEVPQDASRMLESFVQSQQSHQIEWT